LPDERIANGSSDNTIKIWDPKTNLCDITLIGHAFSVCGISVLPDERILSRCSAGIMKIWNLYTEKCDVTFNDNYYIYETKVLADGRIVSHSRTGGLKLWC
jgi:WD40 repeat protein